PQTRLSVGYFRTMHFNQTVVDNEAVTPADYNPYCVTVPTNALLPGGGGNRVCGLADISVAGRARVPRNVTKNAEPNFGKVSEVFNGVDIGINSKFRNGILVQGGVSTGRTVVDSCFVVDSPQAQPLGGANRGGLYQCHVVTPWQGNTQFKVSGAYPLPLGF